VETIHIVQPFARARASLVPAAAQQFSSPDAAATRAEVIAPQYAGVVAYSMDVDEAGGEYGTPRILFRKGDVPDLD